MNKVAKKMRSIGVADAANEIERLERSNQRRRRAAAKLTAENNSLRAWVLELQMDTRQREAVEFAIRRLYGTLNGNGECDHVDALQEMLNRTR